MAKHPFVLGRRGTTSDARAVYAFWCAALKLAVKGVASALSAECGQHGRLFWISDALKARIRQVGFSNLVRVIRRGGSFLEHLLTKIQKCR